MQENQSGNCSGLQEEKVFLYLANISILEEKEAEALCLTTITKQRRSRLLQYRFEEDRKRSLLAGYLLHLGLKQMLPKGTEQECLTFGKSERGKPFLEGDLGVHFNLSHSGEWVLCGIATQEIGVDIQKEQKVNSGMIARICSEKERACLTENAETGGIISIWGIKEAYSKLSGLGLLQNFRKIHVVPEEERIIILDQNDAVCDRAVFFLPKAPEAYHIAVCTRERVSDWRMNQILEIRER